VSKGSDRGREKKQHQRERRKIRYNGEKKKKQERGGGGGTNYNQRNIGSLTLNGQNECMGQGEKRKDVPEGSRKEKGLNKEEKAQEETKKRGGNETRKR